MNANSAIAPAQLPKRKTAHLRDVSQRRHNWTDADIRKALEALPGLSLLQEQLLFRVACLSLLHGYAWVTPANLAAMLRCSERTLYTATRAVCAQGLLVTVRTWEGLSYLPQWEAMGLHGPSEKKPAGPCPVESSELPARVAESIQQDLPLHPGSTTVINDRDPEQQAVPGDEEDLDALRADLAAAFSSKSQRERELPEPEPGGQLAKVRDRWGWDAYGDVLDVLGSWEGRRAPTAALEALARLLDASGVVCPGKWFRGMLRKIAKGEVPLRQAAPPTDPLEAQRLQLVALKLQLEQLHPDERPMQLESVQELLFDNRRRLLKRQAS